jgi:hypothetical protein
MSRFSEAAVVLACVLAAGPAVGGVSKAPPTEVAESAASLPKPSPAPSLASGRNAPDARERGRSVFKCWQFGRLVYQGPGGPVSADRAQAAIRLTGAGGVQVYDLKSALCILEDAGG